MLILAVMCVGICLGYLWVYRLPSFIHRANSFLQMGCTLFLIYSMGVLLGQRENFWGELSQLGLSSLLLALFPMAFSVAFVYCFTARPLRRARKARWAAAKMEVISEEGEVSGGAVGPDGMAGEDSDKKLGEETSGRDRTALFVLFALAAGIWSGQSLPDAFLTVVENSSDGILYVLMFTVGVSVGANRVVIRKLREMDLRACLTPLGVILGSLVGGAICCLLTRFSIWETAGIGAGMGWYSLSGVLLGDLYGADAGAAAFLSNLMRELFTFLLAPAVMKRLNSFSGIAMAGATSEDTTLPILMRGSSEEVAVYAVINGVLTSAAVPVLIRAVAALSGAGG
ncbi:MAG: lysine exporter LysO family protein [Hydrogeniiclostridium sp.]